MALIETDDDAPRNSVTAALTLVRGIAGLIVVLHGAQELMQLQQLSAALTSRFGLAAADANALAYALAGVELAAGIGLLLGWFTRGSAFVLVCSSAPALAQSPRTLSLTAIPAALELALMLLAIGVLLMVLGGGRFSLDRALSERRRRKAIENDAIWSLPPYVGQLETQSDEELDDPEFMDATHEAALR
jgi:putative oxidoreductase